MSCRISVIIPIYGVEKYIEKCARSLFEQTLKNGIQFIFVNDCTRDNSIELLKKMIGQHPERASQIEIINHDFNRGLAATRITGLNAAKGEYVIFCDSDDWVEPEMYETMLERAYQTEADLVVCQYFVNFPKVQKIKWEPITEDVSILLNSLIDGTIHCGLWNKLIKKSIFKQLIPNFVEGLDMWEDVSVVPRLVHLSQRISIINEPLYHYSQRNSEAYTQKWKEKYSENILSAIRLNNNYFSYFGINVDSLAQRGLLSILAHEDNDFRVRYLETFRKLGYLSKIDYSHYSIYNKILGKVLFNKKFKIADLLIKSKQLVKRIRKC